MQDDHRDLVGELIGVVLGQPGMPRREGEDVLHADQIRVGDPVEDLKDVFQAPVLEFGEEAEVLGSHNRREVQFGVGDGHGGRRHHQIALIVRSLQECRQQVELRRWCAGGDADEVQLRGERMPTLSGMHRCMAALRMPPNDQWTLSAQLRHGLRCPHDVEDPTRLALAHHVGVNPRPAHSLVVGGGHHPPAFEEPRQFGPDEVVRKVERRRALVGHTGGSMCHRQHRSWSGGGARRGGDHPRDLDGLAVDGM